MAEQLFILHLENEPNDRELLQTMLANEGVACDITAVETERDFIAALAERHFDLIVADYTLPSFDGTSALKIVRETYPSIPFVFLTGTTGEDVAVESLKKGAADFVLKTRPSRLVPALNRAVREAEEIRRRREAEENLRAADKRYRDLVERAAEIIYTTDIGGRFVYVNPAGVQFAGFSLEELRQQNYRDLVLPAHRKRVSRVYFKQYLKREPYSYVEFPFRTQSRSIRWVSQSATLIVENGEPTGFQFVARDVTERKHSEDLLQAHMGLVEYSQEHSLQELLQQTLDIVGVFVDSPVGCLHFVEADQNVISLQAWSTRTLREYCDAEGSGLHYDVSKAGVWADAIRRGNPVIHNDYASLPGRRGLPGGHAGLVRELVVPVLREGRVVAVVGVGNKPVEYDARDVKTVSYLADVAWEIVRRKLTEKSLDRSVRRLALLREVDLCIVGSRDLREIIEMVVRKVRDLVSCTRVGVALVDDTGNNVDVYAVALDGETGVLPGQHFKILDDGLYHEMKQGSHPLVRDLEALEEPLPKHFEQLKNEGARSLACAPINAHGECLGYLGFYSDRRDYFTAEHEEILGEVANELATAVYEARVHEQVLRHSAELEKKVVERTNELVATTEDAVARERMYRTLTESAPQVIWLADRNGSVMYLNRAWTALTGLRDEESLGKRWAESLHPDDRARVLAQWRISVDTGLALEGECRFRGKDGGYRTVSYVGVPVRDEGGNIVRWVGVNSDITERKEVEERLSVVQGELLRQERLAALGVLTATVAHELRNPLGTIRGSLFSVAQRTGGKDDAVDRAIQRAERGIGRCDRIVGELLDFARTSPLRLRAVTLDGWLEEVLDELLDDGKIPNGIALTRNFGAGTDVGMAPERLSRALANVIDNAVDAIGEERDRGTRRGTVTVSSRCGEGRAEIRISDTGPGMSPETLERIFEPLFSEKSFGVGLGLPTVKRIMEQHGGGVEVESALGRGTTVTLWLPLRRKGKRAGKAARMIPKA